MKRERLWGKNGGLKRKRKIQGNGKRRDCKRMRGDGRQKGEKRSLNTERINRKEERQGLGKGKKKREVTETLLKG